MSLTQLIKQADNPARDWRHVNELKQEVARLHTLVERLSAGVVDLRFARTRKEGGAALNRYLIIAVQDDTLLCALDSDNDGEPDTEDTVLVAKPWKLQRQPWNGRTVNVDGTQITYTYTSVRTRNAAIQGGATENQVIVPAYLAGVDYLHAMSAPVPNLSGVSLIDVNVDGRAWAKVAV